MRRAICLIFYLVAGLLLVLAQIYTAMAFYPGEPLQLRVFALPVLLVALAPLLAGLALEPGNRLKPAGTLLMIAAGVGAVVTLLLLLTVGNPAMQEAFEPEQRMKLSLWGLLLLSLPMAVIGWLLHRRARQKAKPSALSRMAERLQAER